MQEIQWAEQLKTANEQGARLLLETCHEFLNAAGIDIRSVKFRPTKGRAHGKVKVYARTYWRLVDAYEDLGILMSTWHSKPQFLDPNGNPLPLSKSSGQLSLRNLIQAAGVKLSVTTAYQLMRRSPSVQFDERGRVLALRRVFVLPEFQVPRAALFVDRYLGTLRANSSQRRQETNLLLERNCYVRGVCLAEVVPILRNIRTRAAALVDSVDGEFELRRPKRLKGKPTGEAGLLLFAWARRTEQTSNRSRRSRQK